MGSFSECDVAGEAAVEAISFLESGMTVFEEVIAFLWDFPSGAGFAASAGVCEGPCDAFPDERFVCASSYRLDDAYTFVAKNGGSWAVAAAFVGVEV